MNITIQAKEHNGKTYIMMDCMGQSSSRILDIPFTEFDKRMYGRVASLFSVISETLEAPKTETPFDRQAANDYATRQFQGD